MQRRTKVAFAVVAVAAIASAGAFEYLTSSAPGNPCAGVPLGAATAARVAGATLPAGSIAGRGAPAPQDHPSSHLLSGSGPVLSVVAAENFWGSLVAQMGGNQTTVLSIVTDPNADPHEYEASTSDAQAVASARLVIVNGVGYDQWALDLINASNTPGQLVLNVGELNGVYVGGGIVSGNPHMWYNPLYVNHTLAAMYADLASLQPASAGYFSENYAALNASLGSIYGRATEIRSQFAGTEVASTESIFVYLANFTGLDLVSPPEFMQAVAEGNEPPSQSVVVFQCQLESGHVKVLVYNQQTVTPTTTSMKAIAASYNVSMVGVTETIQPPDASFQDWMGSEYIQLQNALDANALGA